MTYGVILYFDKIIINNQVMRLEKKGIRFPQHMDSERLTESEGEEQFSDSVEEIEYEQEDESWRPDYSNLSSEESADALAGKTKKGKIRKYKKKNIA